MKQNTWLQGWQSPPLRGGRTKSPLLCTCTCWFCSIRVFVVEPVTETGRVYKMSSKEMESATKALMERNPQVHV